MAIQLSRNETAFIRSARVAHLATADRASQPHVVPICFVYDGKNLYSPIDEKPKQAAPEKLKRLKNIRVNSQVSLVIDRYDEDWRRLAYVLITGKARILSAGVNHNRAVGLLRRKYRQYRGMMLHQRSMIQIIPTRCKRWGKI